MKSPLWALVLGVLALSGCGGGGGGGTAPPPGPTGRAMGIVRQRSNGQPVAGASVTFASQQGTTNAQGQFTIDGVPVGTAQYRVAASGFAAATGSLPTPIATGDNAVPDILLSPSVSDNQPGVPFSLQGRVTVAGQADASGVTVAALDATSLAEVDRTQTGPDGRYTLWVPPGSYRVRASRAGLATQERQASVADVNQPVTVDFQLAP